MMTRDRSICHVSLPHSNLKMTRGDNKYRQFLLNTGLPSFNGRLTEAVSNVDVLTACPVMGSNKLDVTNHLALQNILK